MNSLSNGFLYVVGFGWALTECGLVAVAGNSVPILLFLLVFVLAFSILGCLNHLSDATVNKAGAITAGILALSLVFFSIGTIASGSLLLGTLKLAGSAIFVLAALVAFTAKGQSHAAHHHH